MAPAHRSPAAGGGPDGPDAGSPGPAERRTAEPGGVGPAARGESGAAGSSGSAGAEPGARSGDAENLYAVRQVVGDGLLGGDAVRPGPV